ncbi:MAG: hypothetical protein EPO21_18380 [Chloroflexota bacterium]|nr:MAG: hypothetical protein EPO21_18380 [Chloroflexota bacterium]
MKRRRLLILNAVLAALALIVMSTGGALAFQPPLTALDKIDVPDPSFKPGVIVYTIGFTLSADQANVKITDTLRGISKGFDLIPATVVCVGCPIPVPTVVNQLNSSAREDWGFFLGNLPAGSYLVVFEVAVTADAPSGTLYNSATLSTATGWKGAVTTTTTIP